MLENYKDVLSIEDVMQILGIGKNTVYKLLQTNELPNRKLRNKYIIPKIGIENYLKSIN